MTDFRWLLTRKAYPRLNAPNDDGAAFVGDEPVGRVFRIEAGPQRDQWKWSMVAIREGVDLGFLRSGRATTKDEGKRLVEEAYAELMRRVDLAKQKGPVAS